MKVELLNYTPHGDQLITQEAKLYYSQAGLKEIKEKLPPEEVSRFVKMLVGMDHMSPIEHVSFSFYVEGIPRAYSHQLVQHRLASYSQQSQRYVRLDQFDYVVPPAIEKNPEAREIFIQAMGRDQRGCQALVDSLVQEELTKGPVIDKERRAIEKRAIEDTRYVFPNACETRVILAMNVRTLLHFFFLRTCNRAQWEIREVTKQMLLEVKEVYPKVFAKTRPGCLQESCPEGAMTYGRIKEVREYFLDGQK